MRRQGWRRACRLWLLCLLTYGFFVPGNNPNAISRVALSLAIVQRHALNIDPFATFTIDKAVVDGAAFSDKAPGLSLLALPAVAVAAAVLDPAGDGAAWFAGEHRLSRAFSLLVDIASFSTVALLSAMAVVAVERWSLSRGTSGTAALLGAVTLGFATPAWGWATVFFGHAASGGLLLLGFIGLARAMEADRPAWWASLSGLALGAAFVVEFPAGPAVAIIGISCAVAAILRPDRWALAWRVFAPAAAGLGVMLLLLAGYNALAFGSPWQLGYASVQGFEGMRTGVFGVSWPSPEVAFDLLFGWYRGLLPLSPVLILYPIAIAGALRDPAWRLAGVVSLLVFLYYLVMNSGYYYWDGGFSTGPRHLVPALPFLVLPLARLWDTAGRAFRVLFLMLLTVSVELSLVCAATDMFVPPSSRVPIAEILLPTFFSGNMQRTIAAQWFGLSGAAALAPLAALWVVLGWKLARRPDRA